LLGYQFGPEQKLEIDYRFYTDKRGNGVKVFEKDGSYESFTDHNLRAGFEGNIKRTKINVKAFYFNESYYRQNENINNSAISYYLKGSLIALILDLVLIHETDGQHRLDDLVRNLYNRTYRDANTGFTYEDLKQEANQLAGRDLTELFSQICRNPGDIDFEKYFALVGLKWEPEVDKSEENTHSEKPYLGVRFRDQKNNLRAWLVERDAPAQRGGLQSKDEIIAIDGFRVTGQSELETIITNYKPGETVNFTISRHGILQEIGITLAESPPETYTLRPNPEADEKTRQMFTYWSGCEFDSVLAEFDRDEDKKLTPTSL